MKNLLNNKKWVNQKGTLSVDFLFTFSVSILLVIFFLMVSLTFSLMETAQYIAFKTSRVYFIGNESAGVHEEVAKEEFNRLNNQFFKPGTIMKNWFELSEDRGVSDVGSQNSEVNLFVGTHLRFTSKVLGIQIPFLRADQGPAQFEIASYLGREPSKEECVQFKKQKFQVLSRKPSYDPLGDMPPDFFRQGNGC